MSLLGLVQASQARQPAPAAPLSAGAKRAALAAYGRLPLAFAENRRQADARIRYYAQGPGYGFAFARGEALFSFAKGRKGATLALRFLGAGAKAEPEGIQQLPGRVNYLLGDDRGKWRTGLPTYAKVVYRDLWPGIDMVFRGAEGQLKYEFHVAPRADVGDIRLAYRGVRGLSLDGSGNLRIRTPLGTLGDSRPLSYQELGGRHLPVESRFLLGRGGEFGFAIGAYDRSRPLVIDPGVVYSTYLGGASTDRGAGIAIDASGNAYVTGQVQSANFPTTLGAFDTSLGATDAFVTKLNASGSALLYSTYLGGSSSDQGFAIAVDGAGSAHVTGQTFSTNFPTTLGAFDTTLDGFDDAFVAKLNATGSALLYSTYLGGSGTEQGYGIAVDAADNAYVAGLTGSTNFPTTPGAADTTANGGTGDPFVTKLNATGSALLYSTYLGGSGFDRGLAVAVDAFGSAYVTGHTSSTDFPATPGAFDTTANGGTDAFVTKMNASGSALLYSTYLGGSTSDVGFGIAVDAAGNAYATGSTGSTNFPTTLGAFDTTANGFGSDDAFVTKLNASGSGLLYSTYLGGSSADQGFGIVLDGAGSAYVTGQTFSSNLPTTPGAFDTSPNGANDAFVTKLSASGSGLLYSTYLGGTSADYGRGIVVDGTGSAYVTGVTGSTNFPTTLGAFDTTANGADDVFVTKLDLGGTPATLTLAPKTATNTVGTPHTVTATVSDVGGNPVSGVTVRFSVSGANSASGSDVTDAYGEATFTYTGTTAGTDAIFAFADSDNDTVQDAGEPSDTATKLWTPGAAATLTLAPPAATNTVGTTHCLTATVRDAFGNPVSGVSVRFSVPTATATAASPASGSDVTDANGEASFCYSASLPGEDAIHAFADTNNDTDQDAGEPFGDATKTWTLPTSTDFCEVKITQGGWIVANNGDRASFGGNAKVAGDGETVQGQENYQDHGPAQPRHVKAIELTAMTCSDDRTMGTIYGRATVDGTGNYAFRIDVTDQGEPGTNDSYGIILSDGYASGQKQLQGGNVQIHRS